VALVKNGEPPDVTPKDVACRMSAEFLGGGTGNTMSSLVTGTELSVLAGKVVFWGVGFLGIDFCFETGFKIFDVGAGVFWVAIYLVRISCSTWISLTALMRLQASLSPCG